MVDVNKIEEERKESPNDYQEDSEMTDLTNQA